MTPPVLPGLDAPEAEARGRRARVLEALLRRDRARARLAGSLDVAVHAINAGAAPGDAILLLLTCRDEAAVVDWSTADVICLLTDELIACGVDAGFVRAWAGELVAH